MKPTGIIVDGRIPTRVDQQLLGAPLSADLSAHLQELLNAAKREVVLMIESELELAQSAAERELRSRLELVNAGVALGVSDLLVRLWAIRDLRLSLNNL